jgi:hypothetical protein
MTRSMDIKPQMILNQVGLLAKKIAKILIYGFIALVLIYLVFKAWEYKAESDQQDAVKKTQTQQSEKFANVSQYVATYSPLVVGSSSLTFVQRSGNELLFKHLLGTSYQNFISALENSASLVYVGSQILGSGCPKLGCAASQAAFVIDPSKGRIYAALIESGKTSYYGLTEGQAVPPAFEKWVSAPLAGGAK